jgi:soluble lytic murein transglycosylase-like protein
MFVLTMTRALHIARIRSRLALVAVGVLLLAGFHQVAAQAEDARVAVDTSIFVLPDEDADEGDGRPPSMNLPVARALAPTDLPPRNPLSASFPRASIAFGRDWRAGRNEYRALIEREAHTFGLPPALVDAVMAVESRYNSASVGLDGEVGLMQVMLPTARMLGFTGTPSELAAPETNVHYGAKYLAGAWRLAGGDLCTAAMKYRAGHGETRFSFLSVEYCMRVRSHLAANGVAVSGAVPQPTFGRSGGAQPRGRAISGSGAVNIAALNTRLRALTERRVPNPSN